MIAKVPQVRAGKISGVDAARVARARGDVVEVADRFGLSPAEVFSARAWWEKRQGKARKHAAARRKKESPAAWTRRLDKLAGDLVRGRGVCEALGTKWHRKCQGPLQWCHGISRRHYALRWEPLNAWSMCAAAHVYFTHHPFEWHEFMQRWPERWNFIVATKDFEVPKGAARVVWLQQIEKRLRELSAE